MPGTHRSIPMTIHPSLIDPINLEQTRALIQPTRPNLDESEPSSVQHGAIRRHSNRADGDEHMAVDSPGDAESRRALHVADFKLERAPAGSA